MKMEQQVCSLELAKRLKALGLKQESLFWWVQVHFPPTTAIWELSQERGSYRKAADEEYDYSAFTAAELGEMLPTGVDARSKKDGRRYISYFLDYQVDGFLIQYVHHLDTRQVLCEVSGDTEANARASMLCYLIENNLITL